MLLLGAATQCMCAVPQDALRANGINPRTKEPFKRKSGAYKITKDKEGKPGVATVLKAVMAANKSE